MPVSIEILTAIRTNTYIEEHLNIEQPQLHDITLMHVLEALKSNIFIKSLLITNCELGPAELTTLAANTRLTSLYLYKTHLGETGTKIIATSSSITDLAVIGCNIGTKGLIALTANTTITALNVRYNKLGGMGTHLAKNTTLRSLDVSYCNMRASDITHLARNTTITDLCLYGNKIDKATIGLLARNPTLTSLNIGKCDIDAAGAIILATNIIKLNKLDISDNAIGDTGIISLAANTTITELTIKGIHFVPAGAKALAANTTLTYLDFSDHLTGAELKKILQALPDKNKRRTVANVAALATTVASFRAQPSSEINASVCDILPIIYAHADFSPPTVEMKKVIGATFFNNLVRDPIGMIESKEVKENNTIAATSLKTGENTEKSKLCNGKRRKKKTKAKLARAADDTKRSSSQTSSVALSASLPHCFTATLASMTSIPAPSSSSPSGSNGISKATSSLKAPAKHI